MSRTVSRQITEWIRPGKRNQSSLKHRRRTKSGECDFSSLRWGQALLRRICPHFSFCRHNFRNILKSSPLFWLSIVLLTSATDNEKSISRVSAHIPLLTQPKSKNRIKKLLRRSLDSNARAYKERFVLNLKVIPDGKALRAVSVDLDAFYRRSGR